MALWSAFYDALNNDRVYNADEFCRVFDGFIEDGVFPLKGGGIPFRVTTGGNLNVTIGPGRAWFANRFIENDANTILAMPAANGSNPRYDCICIKVDKSDAVRAASFEVIQGTAAASPSKPTPTNTAQITRHPIAYVYRSAGQTSISTGNITNLQGTTATPYAKTVTDIGSDLVATEIANQIPNTYGRREIIVVADSYGSPTDSGDASNPHTFIDYMTEIANTFSKWTVHSVYKGGASFMGVDSDTTKKYLNLLKNDFHDDITPANITDIVVVGGLNEVNNFNTHGKTEAQVRAAIREFVTYCHNTYPNANVMIAPVGKARFNYDANYRMGYTHMMNCWAKPYEAGCLFTPLADADCVLIRYGYFGRNNYHPSNTGSMAIANAIISALMGNGPAVIDYSSGSLTATNQNNNVSSASGTFEMYRRGRNVMFMLKESMGVSFNNPQTFPGYQGESQSGSNGVRVAMFNDPESQAFLGGMDRHLRTTVPIAWQDGSNNWHITTGSVYIYGMELFVQIHNIGSNGWANTSVKYLGIPPFTITGDAGLCCI